MKRRFACAAAALVAFAAVPAHAQIAAPSGAGGTTSSPAIGTSSAAPGTTSSPSFASPSFNSSITGPSFATPPTPPGAVGTVPTTPRFPGEIGPTTSSPMPNSQFNSQLGTSAFGASTGSSVGGSTSPSSAGVLGTTPNSAGVVGGTGPTNLGVSPAARPCVGPVVGTTVACQ